ncbi:hypothetical protein RRG08_010983 [Elysia crispata]|uniref:Uncharacterized protein n=1 Tax=Elysia crispata TaxID=231223 RepID=A0AAE0XVD5_9GAST|nr:hypothetical protein RRG08_010983 [Elysia crispata]
MEKSDNYNFTVAVRLEELCQLDSNCRHAQKEFHMLNQGKETGNEERDRVEWSVCTKMEISPTKDPPLLLLRFFYGAFIIRRSTVSSSCQLG